MPSDIQDAAAESGTIQELARIPVLILAGGRGERLRPVFDSGPKPMVPVEGTPFLSYQLRWLRRGGLRRIVLCVGYMREQLEKYVGDGSSLGLQIEYSIESEPLGTGGALRQATAGRPAEERFFGLNGDSMAEISFEGMLRQHLRSGAAATIALVRAADAERYGRVEFDGTGRVTGFFEKDPCARSGGFINAGVYLFERRALDGILASRPASLERDVMPLLVGSGLQAFPVDGYFIDIGIPRDLARAQQELKTLFGLASEDESKQR